MADLDFDIGCRQNGDVGRCYPVKEQFSVVRQQSVLGKGLDAQELLDRTAFSFVLQSVNLHSKYCCADRK